jgi:hypothetical protein
MVFVVFILYSMISCNTIKHCWVDDTLTLIPPVFVTKCITLPNLQASESTQGTEKWSHKTYSSSFFYAGLYFICQTGWKHLWIFSIKNFKIMKLCAQCNHRVDRNKCFIKKFCCSEGVEGLFCKRPIQCLVSSEILTPIPSPPGECVSPRL